MSGGVLIVIASDVPVVRLAEALASAGLAIRHDSGRLIIRRAGRVRTIAPELARRLNRLSLPAGGPRPGWGLRAPRIAGAFSFRGFYARLARGDLQMPSQRKLD